MKFKNAGRLISTVLCVAAATAENCKLETSTQKFDLTPLKASGDNFYAVSNAAGDQFYLNVCGPLPKKVDESASSVNWDHTALYVKRKNQNSGIVAANYANDEGVLRVEGDNLLLVLPGPSDKSRMIVNFVCNSQAGKGGPKYVYDSPDGFYVFNWFTSNACPTTKSSPLGGFATFLILLMLGIGVYFLGGILYNRYNGRVGFDQIPHLDFWRRVTAPITNLVARLRGTDRYTINSSNYEHVRTADGAAMLDPNILDEESATQEL